MNKISDYTDLDNFRNQLRTLVRNLESRAKPDEATFTELYRLQGKLTETQVNKDALGMIDGAIPDNSDDSTFEFWVDTVRQAENAVLTAAILRESGFIKES